ncbi:hypothetical protein ACFPYI_01940 [Halomarina salina]|uniref:Phage head morphogenesis domain-containing protein n=1 Tax=Halomarina salina TaxID=1872699 RepID=A0ABD5RIA6_9EURY|nr:hypothetical protein [Halomarina salina]
MAESGPTRTKTLRGEYRVRVAKPFRRLKGAVRTTVIDNDALRIGSDVDALVAAAAGGRAADTSSGGTATITAAADDIQPASGFTFDTDAEAQDEFIIWLERQANRGILEVTSRQRVRNGEHFTARYVRSAYSRGVQYADARLHEEGVETPEASLQATFNQPVHAATLEQLYTRSYDELATVSSDMQTAVRRELGTGLSQGWNPRKTARNLNDRIDKIGITDAERLARTETLHSHNSAAGRRYGEMGVEKVNVLTHTPCSICTALEAQNPWPVEATPIVPDQSHPNCVCTIAPVVT